MPDLLRAAQCSSIAYLAPGIAREMALAVIGLALVSEAPNGRAYVATDGTAYLAVFRGTDDPRDIILDGDILLVGDPATHQGMLLFYEGVADWLAAEVMRVPGASWEFLGHSLGASGATEAALRLKIPGLMVITFGSPRCGLGAFADAYRVLGITTVRITHDQDIIPQLPSLPLWEHVCQPLHLNDQGQVIEPPSDLVQQAESIGRQALADLDGVALSQHHVSRYLLSIQAYLARTQPATLKDTVCAS